MEDTYPKVAIGIPFYGAQDADFWAPLVQLVASLPNEKINYRGILTMGSMATDHNRNSIVRDFLKTDAEWLFWIDADTKVPAGAIQRLLGSHKTLVSGLYYGKHPPHPPIAYYRTPEGAYKPMDTFHDWNRGELIPVDATGLGCMLTHRSVYEEIQATHTVLQRRNGGLMAVHNDDIRGKIAGNAKHPYAGTVHKGVLYEQLIEPIIENYKFPWFALEYGRTEDMYFFNLAHRLGHKPWLDTSVVCDHIRPLPFGDEDYHAFREQQEWEKFLSSDREVEIP